jgi:hypothetical protein
MTPVLIENGHPICKLCRKALKGLGREPDPKRLYLLQLLEWTFETGEVKDRSGEVEGTIREMSRWKPRNVLDFVTGKNGPCSLPLPRESLTPRELAYYLLLLLQASVAESQSGLFPPLK